MLLLILLLLHLFMLKLKKIILLLSCSYSSSSFFSCFCHVPTQVHPFFLASVMLQIMCLVLILSCSYFCSWFYSLSCIYCCSCHAPTQAHTSVLAWSCFCPAPNKVPGFTVNSVMLPTRLMHLILLLSSSYLCSCVYSSAHLLNIYGIFCKTSMYWAPEKN